VRVANGQYAFGNLSGLGPTFALHLEKQLGLAFYRENLGRSRNQGVELLLRHTTNRFMWLVAYTLSSAERYDTGMGMGMSWRPFELDQRHNLNVAFSTIAGKWRLGSRVHIVSGMPYSPTIGQNLDGSAITDPYAGQLPTFFQLDLRADRMWQRCWGQIDLYFDIQNVTNRTNVEGREPNAFNTGDDDINGLPLMPFIGVEFVPQ
jgi:outer membrane receptor protein involved in Fe transport